MSKLDNIHEYLMFIGSLSGCHQMPERSFFIGKYQFPICARCSGVMIGYILGLVLFFFIRINIMICTAMCMIMYADWKLQNINLLQSTNLRRLITGIICGIGYIHAIDFFMNIAQSVFTDFVKL